MAQNPTAAPILFDRALLRARQDRARRGEPATFLLDRVTEDMADRLAAVTREFSDVADIWTPGPALDEVLGSRCKSIRHLDLGHSETLPIEAQSLDLAVSEDLEVEAHRVVGPLLLEHQLRGDPRARHAFTSR